MSNFEQELISLLEKRFEKIGDDCAVFDNYLITTDSLVEFVHFSLSFSTPFQVGVKTACANLSDIAAMGGKPDFFLTSISIPEDKLFFVDGFLKGLEEILNEYKVKLIGGDTTGSQDCVFINAVAIGTVNKKPVMRSGAKPGDKVYVCGVPGYSAIGYYILVNNIEIKNPHYAYAVKKHLEPFPQVNEGLIIGEKGIATSMIDISDGLSKEINEICKKSGTGCVLYSDLFVLPEIDLFGEEELINYFLNSGEEYILLFTSPLSEIDIKRIIPDAFQIGEITEKDGVFLKKASSLVKLNEFTYNHFDNEKGLY